MKTFCEKILDDFVERFYNGDYTLKDEASQIVCSDELGKRSILHMLTEAIYNYTTTLSNIEAIDPNDHETLKEAYHEKAKWMTKLLTWLTHARNIGIIIETESMTSKTKNLRDENSKLKDQITNSPIVKCSNCKQILLADKFNEHKCNLKIKSVKSIPVAYFVDTSCNDKKYMTGWGIDGTLYTFEVTQRTPIPLIEPIRRKETPFRTDDKETEPQIVMLIY
jgi:hypothetical protein